MTKQEAEQILNDEYIGDHQSVHEMGYEIECPHWVRMNGRFKREELLALVYWMEHETSESDDQLEGE